MRLCFYRRQGPERIGSRETHAQTDPQKPRRLHQRPAIRNLRPFRGTVAHVARVAVHHVANDRANPIREIIRNGAHRTTLAGDATRR